MERNYDINSKMRGGFPAIRKLGAVSPNCESSPFTWDFGDGERLMRLELYDRSIKTNCAEPSFAVIRDCESGEILSSVGKGCYYFSFYKENDTAYVLGTKSFPGMTAGNEIMIFESRDLIHWTGRSLLKRPGWVYFNTSLTKDETGYVLALEAGEPKEAVGPYVFTQYEVNRLIGHLGYCLVKALDTLGYKAMYTHNLTGAGSVVGSPRGEFADAACNSLEAVAAGLGRMTLNGCVETEAYGIHQRFIAVVTDAPLDADEVKEGLAAACEGCDICRKACPTCALCQEKTVEIELAGKKVPYLPVDANRCSWATKYALVCEEGNMYGGNFTNIPYPEELTEEKLAEALRQQDNVFKFRPVMGERCIVTCPLKGRGTR